MNPDRRFLILSVAMPPLVLAAFLIGYFARPSIVVGEELDVVEEAYARIQQRYNGPVETQDLREGAIEGMVRTLDEYCDYFTREEWEKFNADELLGEFGGVGIIVEPDSEYKYIVVVTTIPRTPASRTEILPGDRITAVDGKSLKEKGVSRAVQWIRGPVDEPVKLTMWRESEDKTFDVTIKRAKIKVPALHTGMLDEEKGVGYIRIIKFQELMDEFDRKFAELKEQGAKALIVDLRFNGGGLLRECVTLSDRFIDEGAIVSTKGKTSRDNQVYPASEDETKVRIPVVVLVNESTASASEIFAGAIQDHKRGYLVGARTYGKGSVQTPLPLSDGSWVKVTTARYYTPNGTSVHREKGKKEYGLHPDYLIETTDEEAAKIYGKLQNERYGLEDEDEFKDPQLAAALKIIDAVLAGKDPAVEPRIVKKKDE